MLGGQILGNFIGVRFSDQRFRYFLRRSLLDAYITYDPATMAESRSRSALRTVLRIACDLVRLVSAAGRSRAQLSAENLFLRKQLALYVERQVKPRRADDATRIALVALSWLIEWRRILTVVKRIR